MKDIIYVTGHKNPDSDSICAAIAYADFKNKTSDIPAIPIRLGNVSRETKFILDYFNVAEPKLVTTVKTQVCDLDVDKIQPLSAEISLKKAWEVMKNHSKNSLPVIDENDKLTGLLSLSNLTATCMDIWDADILAQSNTTIDNIIETLSATPMYIDNPLERLSGKIVVGAMSPEHISEFVDEKDIVICGDREDSQTTIVDQKASLMIITGNHEVSQDMVDKCRNNHCSVILTPYDTFTTARLITQSIPIKYVMAKKELVSFRENDFVEDVREKMLETRYRNYPVVDKDNKVIGVISRYHLISKNQKKIVLVDHNEKSQSVHGLEDAQIFEIIDHHRVGDIETGSPIYFRNEPVGSTSTIVASIFFENGLRPSKQIAGILCGAIISDTLMLKSPTSTMVDRMILERLAAIAGINPETFSKEMFIAGTSLEGKTGLEIFNTDFKNFALGSLKVGVSQVTTMDLEGFIKRKDEFVDLMNDMCEKNSYDILALLATDIIESNSNVICVGPHMELINEAFHVTLEENCAPLPGVVSRKKQFIPPLSKVITK
ncbi:manganese-dependent inorganic pyrophosphatase [Hathewaya proteolytica DSM 3090]|uniref:inorganic diphosphatase n=1 Tax=Hathewaya proteolytica DSM 3090 TaxID=1121331 RepID=A0A1M6L8B5_9CLOT|nr:putative manganese-dependent inorganic diphosphatase [Hathewaya proteolytica]SHJ67498.1 manganese-dependent inorganic pyrophosphatase [Hathewaya proteolytica DSM 3090]